MRRRHFLGAFALAGSAGPAIAQAWPVKPLTFVVPFAPGGTSDILARAVATRISPSLGQPVLVLNRPGAGGNMGAQMVARSAADGYTLLAAPSAILSISRWVYRNPGYDADRDFAPIILAGRVPNVLLVSPDIPVRDAQELVRLAKRLPGRLTYASMGAGTTGHLSGEMLQILAGVQMQHVPYRGSAPALTDLLGGHVDVMFDNLPTALPLVQAGKLKALAVTSPRRSRLLPDVPTLAEVGVRGYEAQAWFGFVAPAGTPQAVLERLNAEISAALADPFLHAELSRQGIELMAGTRAEFARFISEESRVWRLVAEKSGVRVE